MVWYVQDNFRVPEEIALKLLLFPGPTDRQPKCSFYLLLLLGLALLLLLGLNVVTEGSSCLSLVVAFCY